MIINRDLIEANFTLPADHYSPEVRNAVEEVIRSLEAGTIRVAEKIDGQWVTNQWVKKSRSDELQDLADPGHALRLRSLLRQSAASSRCQER